MRSLIIGIFVIACITFLAFGAYVLFLNKSSTTTTPPTLVSGQIGASDRTRRVFIKDFYTYNKYFSPQEQRAVESTLYTYASQRETVADLYTGTIRKDEINSTTTISKFNITIQPIHLEYILEVENGSNGLKPIVIRCAPDEQQKEASVPCIDGVKSRE